MFNRQQRSIALASAMASKSCRELPLVQRPGTEAKPGAVSPEHSSPALLDRPLGASTSASGLSISKASKSAADLHAITQTGFLVSRVWTLAAGPLHALATGACVPATKLELSPASMQTGSGKHLMSDWMQGDDEPVQQHVKSRPIAGEPLLRSLCCLHCSLYHRVRWPFQGCHSHTISAAERPSEQLCVRSPFPALSEANVALKLQSASMNSPQLCCCLQALRLRSNLKSA